MNESIYHAIHKQQCHSMHCIGIELVETLSFIVIVGVIRLLSGTSVNIRSSYINMIYTFKKKEKKEID